MNEIVTIAEQQITAKEYNGQRVVTLADIDRAHQRKSGTSNWNFHNHKDRFVEGKDYFKLNKETLYVNFTLRNINVNPKTGTAILITFSGYLMLAKSLTDDKAWAIQRELVDNYFNLRPAAVVPYRTMRCPACSRMNPADSNYCNKCGVELKTKEQRAADSLRELISSCVPFLPGTQRDPFRDTILEVVTILESVGA